MTPDSKMSCTKCYPLTSKHDILIKGRKSQIVINNYCSSMRTGYRCFFDYYIALFPFLYIIGSLIPFAIYPIGCWNDVDSCTTEYPYLDIGYYNSTVEKYCKDITCEFGNMCPLEQNYRRNIYFNNFDTCEVFNSVRFFVVLVSAISSLMCNVRNTSRYIFFWSRIDFKYTCCRKNSRIRMLEKELKIETDIYDYNDHLSGIELITYEIPDWARGYLPTTVTTHNDSGPEDNIPPTCSICLS